MSGAAAGGPLLSLRPGAGSGPLPGGVSSLPALPGSPRPLSGPLLVWSGRLSLPAPSRPPSSLRPSLPGWKLLGTGTQSPRTRRRGGRPRRCAHAPASGKARGAGPRPREGSAGRGGWGRRRALGPPGCPQPGGAALLTWRPTPPPPAARPGPAMAAPRPPPVISVSAPAFYAPQKKFGPVVAPKPKVNPFRPGDSDPPAAAGAQRAQMGRVGEIPPPPPEGISCAWGLDAGRRQGGGGGFGNLGVPGKVVAEGAGRSYPVPSRCSYLIVELMAGSQGSWDRSKSPAWGWEARIWARNLPFWIRSPTCNGSCPTPLPSRSGTPKELSN